jgi:hypothetical protein
MSLDFIYYAVNDLMIFEELFAGPFVYEIPDKYLYIDLPIDKKGTSIIKISTNLAEDILIVGDSLFVNFDEDQMHEPVKDKNIMVHHSSSVAINFKD